MSRKSSIRSVCVLAETARCAEDVEQTVMGTSDIVEEWCFALCLICSLSHCDEFEVRTHFDVNIYEGAIIPERLNESSEVEISSFFSLFIDTVGQVRSELGTGVGEIIS